MGGECTHPRNIAPHHNSAANHHIMANPRAATYTCPRRTATLCLRAASPLSPCATHPHPPSASEAIAACQLALPPSAPKHYVLLHMRVTPASLEVRVKAATPALAAAVAAAAQVRLK